MTDPLATVVIVTWNGAHLLTACLDSLREQTMAPELLLTVVVDNGSTDGTDQLLRAYSWVRVRRSEVNLGFAGGATLGLQGVQTPYAVVLNNDARAEPDWLESLLAGFADDDVAAVTSKVVLQPRYVPLHVGNMRGDVAMIDSVAVDGRDVTDQVVAQCGGTSTVLVPIPDGQQATVTVRGDGEEQKFEVRSAAPRVDVINSVGGMLTESGHGADRGYLEVDDGQYDHDVDVFAICGAAAAFRTDIVGRFGWFDPWFFAYYEDLDLSWRLRRAGWRLNYVAAARVRHQHAATSRVGSDVFVFHNRRNRLATLARNATTRQVISIVRHTRLRTGRADSAPPAVVLGHRRPPEPVDGQRVRGRRSALLSFLRHLPVILMARSHDRRRAKVVSPAHWAAGASSGPSTGG